MIDPENTEDKGGHERGDRQIGERCGETKQRALPKCRRELSYLDANESGGKGWIGHRWM
jgi:hypothetical protein